MRKLIIGVMGPGDRASERAVAWARELGRLIAERGWVLLSGGRDAGAMDAVSHGAHDAGGLVVGVLPSADTAHASEALDVAIVTGMGSARNNINVLSSDVIVGCGNIEAGTLSEIAMAIKAGKPVVLLTDDVEARTFLERLGRGRLRCVDTPEQAVRSVESIVDHDPRAG